MKPVNMILIMTDQHRYDCFGAGGNPGIETPNLDWLASEGTVFDCAYTPSPSCIPARASLMTGMTPWKTGILGMGGGQGPMGVNFAATLPGELARAGYYTKGVGKMHFYPQRAMLGFCSTVLDESGRVEDAHFQSDYRAWFEREKPGDCSPVDHGLGWNAWAARPWHLEERLHPTVWTASEAINFLETRDPSMPYFLKVSFARPHSPYDPPEYYFNMYKDREVPQPAVGDWAEVNDVAEDAAYFDAWRGRRSPEETRRARQAYYGQVSHLDNQIGRLLVYLRDAGQLDDTLFVFTSDHGDMLGDHNLWRKTYAYEGSARVPMAVKLPRSMREGVQSRVDAPVSLYDIMPTLLAAAGVPVPESVEGSSLLPLIYGKAEGWRQYLHGEHSPCYSPMQEMQYVTDGKYKYIWFPHTGAEQLFCLEDDPQELHELAGQAAHRQVLLQLRGQLVDILEARHNGTTENGALVCQARRPPQVSPHYAERLRTSKYNWMEPGE